MDFFDFSKEARIKEEARIKALENNVINKATKMALDKFSKVYGGTTQVIAKTANLREFKRNYLSGKIASELCISTKQGTKNIPFTILVKASEPSILESDQIIFEKVASAEGSLDAEINNIISRQEQKLANLEAEEQTNKKIIADLAKGISLEASRKNHIFKEAAKSKKKVERNSLSTATTPTDFLGDVVEYFTYPKTFFPAMKVGAIIDIAGVKYKYIGDEATMTEPAGNTNGTIARFELANKRKASLNKEAAINVEALIAELYEEIKKMRGDWGGYDPLEYTVIEANATEDGHTVIQVRDELSYEGMVRLAERLNPIIQKVDPESYFEQVEPGIMEAYLGEGGTKTYASSKSNIEKEAAEGDEKEKIELTDELLDSVVGQQKGASTNQILNQMGAEMGYAGRGCYAIYQRLKASGKENITFRDIYEIAKKKRSSPESVEDPEISEERELFTNPEKLLEAIGDDPDIKNAGYNLKGGDDLYYLAQSNEYNHGLPENRANDILIDIVCMNPDRAEKAINILSTSAMGTTRDNPNIAEKYKKQLFQSVADKYDSSNISRLYGKFPKKFIERYVDLDALGLTTDYTPFEDGKFDFSTVEAFMDSRPSTEKLKKYVEEHDVLNNIDKELERYQAELAKIEEENKKDTNSEDK